ncbi:MAG TPA: hypothetical protein VJ698_22670 [Noviherbaspirillum sp.]|uniref:hypothetical protein n=1 Tax=Noviherbaspirillum sp. TaxID=1926288 RepID=UPI002B48F913|nr:hypothetical protein [Noviherbaspirillum sp.]HJV88291.1 hypothetical protein [Noviherbaspirillum sp.]
MNINFEKFYKLVDPYDLRARLFPALLALVPAFVLIVCVYGEKATLGSALITIPASCGCLFWLARVARNAGISIQKKQWARWGGSPTFIYLRYSNLEVINDPVTKERYHQVMAAGINKKFPSPEEEKNDPLEADNLYRSGVNWLKEQTRDTKKYAHLFKENIAYGFHRNALGIKPVAICIALACLIIALIWTGVISAKAPYFQLDKISGLTFPHTFSILFSLAALLLWIFSINLESVDKASLAYSERLLQSCEGMTKPIPKKRTTKASKEVEKAA